MRIPCNVIKDLLLLYENGEASEETKNLVEEHLKDCDECRVFFHSDSLNLSPLQEQEVLSENQKEAKEIKKVLTKVKRRWKLSIVSALMILPILLISVLTFDQFTGSGIAFTNIDEIHNAKEFMKQLEKQEFEMAAEMLDYTDSYNSVMEAIINLKQQELIKLYGENPTLEEYKQARTKNVVDYLKKMKSKGYSISNLRFNHVYREEGYKNEGWTVQIAFIEHGPESFHQNVIGEFYCIGDKIIYINAMNEKQMSAFEYAMGFNHMWHLNPTPEYEEYLEMEKGNY